jgi:hypothetical protein
VLVRRLLINVPARVVHRTRQVFVGLAAGMLWVTVFKRTYDRLTCCARAPTRVPLTAPLAPRLSADQCLLPCERLVW